MSIKFAEKLPPASEKGPNLKLEFKVAALPVGFVRP